MSEVTKKESKKMLGTMSGKMSGKMSIKIKKWLKQLNTNSLIFDGSCVQCNTCVKTINAHRKSQLDQHLNTNKHQELLRASASTSTQGAAEGISENENTFCFDMCQAMVAISMPWHSLDNEIWRAFLEKYTNENIPSESTMRNIYLQQCYNAHMKKIKDDIGDNFVWISVDETIDTTGRYIANFIVGKLSQDGPGQSHLLACEQLEKINYSTIARFVNSTLLKLWPGGGYDKILLLVTDEAQHMIKAGKTLKDFYPNLIHLTCLAHGINRVAETIRDHFPLVNSLISSVKKVFLKAPLRVQAYREQIPDVPLPPEPVITRWGTWIEAALFYADHIFAIEQVINTFNAEDAQSIKKAQDVLANPSLKNDLNYIRAHFHFLPYTIQHLEARVLSLCESMNVVNDAALRFETIGGEIGAIVKDKFKQVLQNNPAYSSMCKINRILEGEDIKAPEDVDIALLSHFIYAPITSCDVESSFSAYKMILADSIRHNLTVSNMEKIMIIYCNINCSD